MNTPFDEAIRDLSQAIALNPEYAEAYSNIGNAYADTDNLEIAIENYRTTIALNPEYAPVYYNLGLTWLRLQQCEKAKTDFTTAKEKGFDIAAFFHKDYESVADFEEQQGVQVPEDIKALLSGD